MRNTPNSKKIKKAVPALCLAALMMVTTVPTYAAPGVRDGVAGSSETEVPETQAPVVPTGDGSGIDTISSSLAGISAAVTNYTDNDEAAQLEVLRAVTGNGDLIDQYDNLGLVQVHGYLNVRKGRSTDDVICGMVFNNSAVEITSVHDGWYGIRSGEVTGYISSDYVITGTEAQIRALQIARLKAYVNDNGVRVRSAPDLDSETLGSVNKNESYVVTEVLDGWIGIEFDNFTGYISSDLCETDVRLDTAVKYSGVSASTRRNAVVQYAMQFIGNPYVWGGTSLTRGCDCSGFTMQVMAHFGVGLSHSSRAQRYQGRQIPASQARPGDLICYNGHVGICIGGGQLVHAANERLGIIVSSIYHMTPICAVDVLGG